MKLPEWIIKVNRLVINPKAFDWCKLPYVSHPKGCPNAYGRCKGRRRTLLTDVVNIKKPIYIVYNQFNVARHARKMKRRHPEWTKRQCRNLLYWQPKSFKGLSKRVDEALKIIKPTPNFISSGEDHGVNVYATCSNSGLKLDKIAGGKLKICRHLAFLCYSKKKGKYFKFRSSNKIS